MELGGPPGEQGADHRAPYTQDQQGPDESRHTVVLRNLKTTKVEPVKQGAKKSNTLRWSLRIEQRAHCAGDGHGHGHGQESPVLQRAFMTAFLSLEGRQQVCWDCGGMTRAGTPEYIRSSCDRHRRSAQASPVLPASPAWRRPTGGLETL